MSTLASTSTSSQLYGLSSGLDWSTIVNKLVQVEQAPEALLNTQSSKAATQSAAFAAIGTKLTALTTDLAKLKDSNFFNSRSASSSNTTNASASADTGTALGNYAFNVIGLATASVQQGTLSSSKPLSSTSDVSGVVLSSAGFATAVTAGTFTINGQIVNIATTDTLQGVFDKISTATGGSVTGSYDPSSDEISLNSGNPIVLGSSNDTSNFAAATNLFANGSGNITSTTKVGGINLSTPLVNANFTTTITDGGSGAGSLLINGVSISYDASNDAVKDVLQRINNSTAGVTASYDSLNNRFQITNKNQGNLGISLSDTTGNFLTATGILGGTLQQGSNLTYTLNNGPVLTSRSNIIDSTSSSINGLKVSVQQTGTFNINVNSDTSTISSAISAFVSDYNSVQSYISSQIKTSTDSSGTVSAGTFTGNQDVEGLASTLRRLADATPLSGVISNLGSLGINGNGSDNTIALTDAAALGNALANNLDGVKTLFSDATKGLSVTLHKYVSKYNGTDGTIATNTTSLQKRISDIKSTIARLELKITADKNRYTLEFVAYEQVANNTTNQKQYLNSTFSTTNK
jgi:flagellar hook-associated protein 2